VKTLRGGDRLVEESGGEQHATKKDQKCGEGGFAQIRGGREQYSKTPSGAPWTGLH